MKSIADSANVPRAKIFGASVSMLKPSTHGTNESFRPEKPGLGPAVVTTLLPCNAVPPVAELGGVVKMKGRAPPPSVVFNEVLPGAGNSGPIFQTRQPGAATPGSQNQPAYSERPREFLAPPNTFSSAVTWAPDSAPVPAGPSVCGSKRQAFGFCTMPST